MRLSTLMPRVMCGYGVALACIVFLLTKSGGVRTGQRHDALGTPLQIRTTLSDTPHHGTKATARLARSYPPTSPPATKVDASPRHNAVSLNGVPSDTNVGTNPTDSNVIRGFPFNLTGGIMYNLTLGVGEETPSVVIPHVCVRSVGGGRIVTAHYASRPLPPPWTFYGKTVHFVAERPFYPLSTTQPAHLVHFLKIGLLTSNLYHFLKDIAVSLFAVLEKMGALTGKTNSVFFHRARHRSWTDELLRALNINTSLTPRFDVARSRPACYSAAIFSVSKHTHYLKTDAWPAPHLRRLVSRLLRYFDVSHRQCQNNATKNGVINNAESTISGNPSTHNGNVQSEYAIRNTAFTNGSDTASVGVNAVKNVLIVLRRDNRRILNVNDVVTALRHNTPGHVDVQALFMETLSVKQQMMRVACVDVLMGVHGAGLAWAAFMRDGAQMVEIAWPSEGDLSFFYTTPPLVSAFFTHLGIHRLEAHNITDTFEQKAYNFFQHMAVKGGPRHHKNITRELMDKYRREIEHTSSARFSDVWLEEGEVVEVVSKALEKVQEG